MRKLFVSTLICLLAIGPSAFAETVKVQSDTLVPFRFLENGDAKSLAEGMHIPITVTEDVEIKGEDDSHPHLVFKKGQNGYAEVFYASSPGHFATSGRISIHYVYIPDILGREQKLRFDLQRHASRNIFTTIVPLPLVPVVWAMKGKNVTIEDPKKKTPSDYQAKVIQSFFIGTPTEIPREVISTGNPLYYPNPTYSPNPVYNSVPPASPIQNTQQNALDLPNRIIQKARGMWRPPLHNHEYSGSLSYEIDAKGQPLRIEVVQSSGNKEFDKSMVEAVQKAAPFEEVLMLNITDPEETIRLHQTFALQFSKW